MDARFFESADEFRQWLVERHATDSEILVGFHRKATGKPTLTWADSVDEALCFGWIDGIRRRIDDTSYSIRFTPRKRTSTWSRVNSNRVADLTDAGRMQPAGIAAFEARDERRSGVYSHERGDRALDPADEALLRENPAAWEYFQAQPTSYRRAATWWVVSAKKPDTHARRMASLIEHSAAGRRIPQFTWKPAGRG